MTEHSLLINAFVYLVSAVAAVLLAKRLGMGAVLGYLLAGIAIGPWGMGLISSTEDIRHFAEFGVVLLLFLIGLELNPRRLWDMRKSILGLGGSQVLVTTVLLMIPGLLLGLSWRESLVAALGLALSSTAIALQSITEKNLLTTPAGRSGFAVLLFQDIAVIPMLTLIPLLGVIDVIDSGANPWQKTGQVLLVVAVIIIGGHYGAQPVFRLIAKARTRELFTAFSLILVLGSALLMQLVDMSMALGTFLAGVLLADSDYRHQLEADIEPFKALLLGLFFISVGMSIDFGLFLRYPLLVLSLTLLLMAVKFGVLYGLARLFKLPRRQHLIFALLLCQVGEFAFVIFSVATDFRALSPDVAALLMVVVAMSMLLSPLLLMIDEKYLEPRLAVIADTPPPASSIEEENPVVIAGFGRFGQIVARLLHAKRIGTTIIDHNPDHIERVRQFGFKVFYGDATRVELLHAAGLDQARLFVVAIDDRAGALRTIDLVREHFPRVQILARAYDLIHVYELMDRGVTLYQRETFASALNLGEQALTALGFGAHRAHMAAQHFRRHDQQLIERLHKVHQDQTQVVSLTQESREEIERLFAADEVDLERVQEQDWG